MVLPVVVAAVVASAAMVKVAVAVVAAAVGVVVAAVVAKAVVAAAMVEFVVVVVAAAVAVAALLLPLLRVLTEPHMWMLVLVLHGKILPKQVLYLVAVLNPIQPELLLLLQVLTSETEKGKYNFMHSTINQYITQL